MARVMTTRRGVLSGLGAATALTLAGCVGTPAGSDLPTRAARPLPSEPENLPTAQGEVIGTGGTRVALLLPLAGEGDGARVGTEFRNAAAMALGDAGLDAIQLVVKDTGGTAEGARAVASQALRERASLVLGPVFANNVSAAASVLQGSGVPMIAFSSDRSVAGPGVYLNSFLPEGVVDRTLSYAASQGLTDIVAIVPEGPAGDVALAQARETLPRIGARLAAAARYEYDFESVRQAVQSVADAARQSDAIFVPDGGKTPSAIAATLAGTGVDMETTRFLGTGQWATTDLSDSMLAGALFADIDHDRVGRYKDAYRARFGAEPSVNSALAYDSAVLAANIVKRFGAEGFRPEIIENASGFAGYTGIFRFLSDGTSEHGYAVYEVRDGTPVMVSPAPTRFDGMM